MDDYSNSYVDGLHEDREAERDRQAQAREYAREAGAFDDLPPSMLSVAVGLLRAGLCVLPAVATEKRPALASWKEYREHLPTEQQVGSWFADAKALCIVAGAVSGNLEMLDFDGGGALFEPWADLVRAEVPGLLERLVIERSPSGGFHVVYRCQESVAGNRKLSQRTVDGKLATLIETRGEGGLFLCDPSPGYALQQGAFTAPPMLEAAEHDVLIEAARALTEVTPPPDVPSPSAGGDTDRPGDDFNRRGDARAVLLRHGWTLAKAGENEYWRRPGKQRGWSATLKDGVFFCFSSSAAPFEPGKAYGPFAVYTHLEHSGDFARAAAALRVDGFGADPDTTGVDLSGILSIIQGDHIPADPAVPDPGPIPDELLRIPGFVGELMDFSLTTAPYPNPMMAFAGALALQSFLAGRKVRDPGDNRTNLYLLGLAFSSAGKDWPRRINTKLLWQVGLGHCVGDKFASGEGLQDALFLNPAMLFQTDEIDGMLQAINKNRDGRMESLMGTLLTMSTSSASVYPVRRRAGNEHPGSIDQPSLTVFGTAVPTHYYEALSTRMLTNGFFARTIVLEAGNRGEGQEPVISDLPARLIETASWWADYQPGERRGNLLDIHPVPAIVEHTDDARTLLIETRLRAEDAYRQAETDRDEVGTTVWGRVSENVRKLALIYAVSEDHRNPVIAHNAVAWASRFVEHQTRRMLFMASQHVADGEFDADCLKLIRKLHAAEDHTLEHSKLLKRMKMDCRRFQDLISTLVQRGDVEVVTAGTAGRPGTRYRLVVKDGGEGVKEGGA